jgi:mRNA interferase MazF
VSIERGQIYFVNLNPVLGREQAGTRPVLVLSINAISKSARKNQTTLSNVKFN